MMWKTFSEPLRSEVKICDGYDFQKADTVSGCLNLNPRSKNLSGCDNPLGDVPFVYERTLPGVWQGELIFGWMHKWRAVPNPTGVSGLPITVQLIRE